jgi:hypothetical protein
MIGDLIPALMPHITPPPRVRMNFPDFSLTNVTGLTF